MIPTGMKLLTVAGKVWTKESLQMVENMAALLGFKLLTKIAFLIHVGHLAIYHIIYLAWRFLI